MRRPEIITLALQEAEIQRLTERNKRLESGYREVCKINKDLRRKLEKYERNENKLSGVNV